MSARQSRSKKTQRSKRSVKPNRRKNPKLKLYIVSFTLFFISAAFLVGYGFFNKLNKQSASAESANSVDPNYYTVLYARIDDFTADNPVIKQIDYKIFDLQNNKVTSIQFNSIQEVYTGEKYGTVPVAKLYSLARLNADDVAQTVADINTTFAGIFAFPVDRYVFTDLARSDTWDNIFESGTYLPYLTETALSGNGGHYYTNLDLEFVYQMSKFISSLPEERLIAEDFGTSSVTLLDDDFREMTLDSQFALEAKSIAVLNASGKPGIAGETARFIKNLGGRVVSIDNSDAQFDENFIVTDLADDYSTQYLSRMLGVTKVVNKVEAANYINTNEIYRADIIIIVSH